MKEIKYTGTYSPAGKHLGDRNGGSAELVVSLAIDFWISGVSKSVSSVVEGSVIFSFQWCGSLCPSNSIAEPQYTYFPGELYVKFPPQHSIQCDDDKSSGRFSQSALVHGLTVPKASNQGKHGKLLSSITCCGYCIVSAHWAISVVIFHASLQTQ